MSNPNAKMTKDYVNKGGLSRGAIFRAVDASLQRLGTDYIDLLQIHRFDHDTPIEETMKALHDLVQSGKVNYIGASSMWAYQFGMMQQCAEKHGWTKFISSKLTNLQEASPADFEQCKTITVSYTVKRNER